MNSDLIGKFVNIASRTAGFLHKHFEGKLFERQAGVSAGLAEDIAALSGEIAVLYDSREFGKVVRRVMESADFVNGYYDTSKPWELAKRASEGRRGAHATSRSVFVGGRGLRILAIYLAPIMPRLANEAFAFLNLPHQRWQDVRLPIASGHSINS